MLDTDNHLAQPQQNTTIYLNDYQAPPFSIDNVELEFELVPGRTLVTSTLHSVSYTHLTLPTTPYV